MNASELKYNVETRTDSNFFTRESMRFFGDTMKNYGVRPTHVEDYDGRIIFVWELYRRHAVKNGLKSSACFSQVTFERVHFPREKNPHIPA